MSEELECEDETEFKKIIKLFHTYSKWIPSDAIDKVIVISEESDEGMTESLREFADALKAGEDVDIEEEEIDSSHLPDGYMEAMDMFLMAEEISGKKPKRGERMMRPYIDEMSGPTMKELGGEKALFLQSRLMWKCPRSIISSSWISALRRFVCLSRI